jgi:hypothetical protein
MNQHRSESLWQALSDFDGALFVAAQGAPRVPGAYRRKAKRFMRNSAEQVLGTCPAWRTRRSEVTRWAKVVLSHSE